MPTPDTPEARRAMNVMVAEWVGWERRGYGDSLYTFRQWIHPTTGESFFDPPDLFAPTPEGAAYREAVRGKLLDLGGVSIKVNGGPFHYWACIRKGDLFGDRQIAIGDHDKHWMAEAMALARAVEEIRKKGEAA